MEKEQVRGVGIAKSSADKKRPFNISTLHLVSNELRNTAGKKPAKGSYRFWAPVLRGVKGILKKIVHSPHEGTSWGNRSRGGRGPRIQKKKICEDVNGRFGGFSLNEFWVGEKRIEKGITTYTGRVSEGEFQNPPCRKVEEGIGVNMIGKKASGSRYRSVKISP